jgi:predicted membrane protein
MDIDKIKRIIQKLFPSDRGFHDSYNKMRMAACVMSISLIGGNVAYFYLFGFTAIVVIGTALNLAILITLYKPELKKLKDKLFGNDDDFRGGNFS